MHPIWSNRAAGILCMALSGLLVSACGGSASPDPGKAPAVAGNSAPPQGGNPPKNDDPVVETGNTVVPKLAPAGTVRATVGNTSTLTLTFTTDDGKPASDLAITDGLDSLPAGWTATNAEFACASVSTGDACRLGLSYKPTTVAAASKLMLTYRYTDSTGKPQNGTATIDYEAVVPKLAYVVNANSHSITRCTIGADGALSDCKDTGAQDLFRPMSIAFSGSTAYIVQAAKSGMVRCDVKEDGGLSDCRETGDHGFSGPAHHAVIGSHLYVANGGDNSLASCTIREDGSVGGADPGDETCRKTTSPLFLAPFGMAVRDSLIYVTNTHNNSVTVCEADINGDIVNCRDAGATLLAMPEGIGINGNMAYITNYNGRNVIRCAIGEDGLFSGCASAGLTTPSSAGDIVFHGSTAYLAVGSDNMLLQCTVEASGSLSDCINFKVPEFSDPMSITLR